MFKDISLFRLIAGGNSIILGFIILLSYNKRGISNLWIKAYSKQDVKKKWEDIMTIFFGIVALVGGIVVILFGFRLEEAEYLDRAKDFFSWWIEKWHSL